MLGVGTPHSPLSRATDQVRFGFWYAQSLYCAASTRHQDNSFLEPKRISLMRTMAVALLIVVAYASALLSQVQAQTAEAKTDNKLLGTWKMVSAKYGGQEFKFPEGTTTLKHVTSNQFIWVGHDEDGKITRAAGGSYTIKGDTYEEVPQYGLSEDFDVIKGKPQIFKWKVEGNKWLHNGKLSNGLTIEEVWERVVKK
jgi:hypothetical protein